MDLKKAAKVVVGTAVPVGLVAAAAAAAPEAGGAAIVSTIYKLGLGSLKRGVGTLIASGALASSISEPIFGAVGQAIKSANKPIGEYWDDKQKEKQKMKRAQDVFRKARW